MATNSSPPIGVLEGILPEKFRGNLSEAEKRLLRAAPEGDWAVCGKNSEDGDASNDPSLLQGWGFDRTIRAELLRWLCTDADASKKTDLRGIRVYGARIFGDLDLSYAKVPFPILLTHCRLIGQMNLQSATIPMLSLSGTRADSILGNGARVQSSVFLDERFIAGGAVDFSGANIGGDLNCEGASMRLAGGIALDLSDAVIGGGLLLRSGFSSAGEVDIYGIHIGGDLDCGRCSITNPTGCALKATTAEIRGAVFLNDGFSAHGSVLLDSARIDSGLVCTKSTFSNPKGTALDCSSTSIRGSAYFSDGFSATGEVDLYGTTIGGDLECSNCAFSNPGSDALYANTAQINGSAFLRNSFSADGLVSFVRAHVGSDFVCRGAMFRGFGGTGLDFEGCMIGGSAFFSGVSVLGELTLLGASIGGNLDCSNCSFQNRGGRAFNAITAGIHGSAFLADGFKAEGTVSFYSAHLGADLDCRGGNFNAQGGTALDADTAEIGGKIYFSNGFTANGTVTLVGTHIGKDLDCDHGTFRNPGDYALNADHVRVDGAVYLTGDEKGGFSAVGTVYLSGAHVGKDLSCEHATLSAKGRVALYADNADLGGSVLLRYGFSSEGAISLIGTQIAADLDCSEGRFSNPEGSALIAARAKIGGGVFLECSADGTVDLEGIQIGGDFDCQHATLNTPKGVALNLDRAEVSKTVFLSEGFIANGDVMLRSAHIGADLDCAGGKFDTLNLDETSIKQTLKWNNVRSVSELDLEQVTVGNLASDRPSWPKQDKLYLDGFVYGGISDDLKDISWSEQWVALPPDFAQQPYRQLAKVLRELGNDGDSKKILLDLELRSRAESRRKLLRGERWWRSTSDGFSKVTVGFGIYPGRAIWELSGITALGWIIHRRAHRMGAMVPTDKDAYAHLRDEGSVPASYPPFNPLIYSVENSIPLLKLGQDAYWQPGSVSKPTVPQPQPVGRLARLRALLTRLTNQLTSPGALRWYRWTMIVLGWLLATFFVAGLSGIVRTN
jgi:hypothetical protein